MTILNKSLIAGALIIGLQSTTYGYNSTVLNNQITIIEIGKNALKGYDSDPKAVAATRYLKNILRDSYNTSDKIIIQLATILDIDTYSDETLDKITNAILTIKAQQELKAINQQSEWNRDTEKSHQLKLITDTIFLTSSALFFAYCIYNNIFNIITHTITNHDNNVINKIVTRINNNNSLPTSNQQTHWLNYTV